MPELPPQPIGTSTSLKLHFGKMGILSKIAVFFLNFPLGSFYPTENVRILFCEVLGSLLKTWRWQIMKQLLLVLLAACFASVAVQAELVIDDFTLPSAGYGEAVPLDDDIAGTRTVTRTNSAEMTVDGVGGAVLTGGFLGGSRIDIHYFFNTAFNMDAVGGGNRTLLIDLFDTVTGNWSLNAIFTNSANAQASLNPVAVSTPGARSFDYALLPTAFATDVKQLTIRLVRNTDGAVITSSGGLVAAVPEPTSLALLGITGLGGWFVARRRGKKSETVV